MISSQNHPPAHEPHTLPTETLNRWVRWASIAALVVATFLVGIKTVGWLYTGSLSVQASLLDSLLDLLASLINFFVIRHAQKPADEDHRFGHGKAEALGGLAQTAFIVASALWFLIDVAARLVSPEPVAELAIGNSVMILSIGATLGLVLFQRWVIRRTKSLVISADSLHYQADLLGNLAVIISLNLSVYLQSSWVDAIAGGLIAAYILLTSFQILRQSLDVLMDKELPEDIRSHILSFAVSTPEVRGVHEFRTRSSGQHIFIQMHLDLDAHMPLQEAHDVGDRIADEIQKHYPNADVIIHQDPV